MFSPDTPLPPHGHSLRPKRSRRIGSDDSIKPPRAKRQRSALRKDTFEPLSNLSPNQVAVRPEENVAANGSLPEGKSMANAEEAGTLSSTKDLTIRIAKNAKKRSERGSGAMKLTSNDFYSIEQLPALPEQIRQQPRIAYRGIISSDYGYALALTHSESLIWNYNTSSSTPSTKEMFSFKLPFPAAAPSDPLPLGAFAVKSFGTEPGLVVVTPDQGRIVYWDTIANASSFLPGQASSGVQGSIPGMFSGETISEITSAEPAGFILTFSHGRVAHLTVKDQLGRPSIGVQFLRKRGGLHNGGLFDSIRHLVGYDRRKSVAAVRSGRATKGQRDVLIATEEGEFEQWSTDLSGGNSITFELSLKEDLLESLKHNLPGDSQHESRFRLLDFVIVPGPATSDELAAASSPVQYSLLLLISLSSERESTYHIVEAQACAKGCCVNVVHPVSCYQTSIPQPLTWRPRLCVPKPGEVAFIVFETAMVIFSLARMEATPSSQLLMEGQRLPEPFQDCIKFQHDTNYRVLAFSPEDKEAQHQVPSCVLAVQGFGIIRAASSAPAFVGEEPQEAKVTLKSKMEQAIFYGTIRHNPLDLTGTGAAAYSGEEVEAAALSISQEILNSSSKYIPSASPSVEQHLKLRAKALEDLVFHVQRRHGPLPRVLRWELLWGAEKLAAARAMWKVQEGIMQRKPKEREETYWEQLLFFMNNKHRTKADKTKGESDWVRLWLTKDVDRTFYLLNWLFQGHRYVKLDNWLSDNEVIENVRESSDLWIAGLEAAYKFREDNAPFYGLEDEIFAPQQGLLQSGYEDLPDTWTQHLHISQNGRGLLDLAIQTIKDLWEATKIKQQEDTVRKSVVHMVHALPKQVDLYTRSFIERCCWRLANEEGLKGQAVALRMREAGEACRRYFYQVAAFGLVDEAIDLAERWKDMDALVELNAEAEMQAIHQAREDAKSPAREVKKLEQEMNQIQTRTDGYFEKYGSAWANAQFSQMVLKGQLGSLLQEGQSDEKKQPHLTQFFREAPGYRKVSWINDVVCEKDFGHAARTLEALWSQTVDDTWVQKTEVCLGKLAYLATLSSAPNATKIQLRHQGKVFNDRLALLDLQERLYTHMMSCVGPVIDDAGALQVALEVFGQRVVGGQKCPALKALLNDGLKMLLQRKSVSAERLVDVLTLMDPTEYDGPDDDDPRVVGHEFWLALMALQHGGIQSPKSDALSGVIWRRAMIRDDWVVLNDTGNKNDEDVTAAITQTTLFNTLQDYYGYVDQEPEKASAIKLLSPEQILKSDLFPRSLQKRFRENEMKIVEGDLAAEHETLKNYVEKGRLELHYGGLLNMAQAEVRSKSDRKGDRRADKVGKT